MEILRPKLKFVNVMEEVYGLKFRLHNEKCENAVTIILVVDDLIIIQTSPHTHLLASFLFSWQDMNTSMYQKDRYPITTIHPSMHVDIHKGLVIVIVRASWTCNGLPRYYCDCGVTDHIYIFFYFKLLI